MVSVGSGAQRPVEDWRLSRYACYLVIQNADPSKPLAALGQSYFAVPKNQANQIHHQVGRKVRQTIRELGGTMPENLPVAESIKKVESREKKRLKAELKQESPKPEGN